jgi:hypothetical protein
MDRSLVLAVGLLAALAAHAGGSEELSIHAKSLASAGALSLTAAPPSRIAEAPFVSARPRDVVPELLLHEEMEKRATGAGCDASATDLCYDLKEARIVYRPARAFMPGLPGMRAESISLRHDRIVLKYSFK